MGDFYMKKEIEYLNFIYQNAEMGLIGIDDVLENVSDEDFIELLHEQREDYKVILNETREMIINEGYEPKENKELSKITSNLMVKMNAKKENSISILAKLMMEGTNKGIIAIQEKINNFDVSNDKINDLANKLLELEEKNIENLKKFL